MRCRNDKFDINLQLDSDKKLHNLNNNVHIHHLTKTIKAKPDCSYHAKCCRITSPDATLLKYLNHRKNTEVPGHTAPVWFSTTVPSGSCHRLGPRSKCPGATALSARWSRQTCSRGGRISTTHRRRKSRPPSLAKPRDFQGPRDPSRPLRPDDP